VNHPENGSEWTNPTPEQLYGVFLTFEGGVEESYVDEVSATLVERPGEPAPEEPPPTPEQLYGVWLDFEGGVEECYVGPGAPDDSPPAKPCPDRRPEDRPA
jgi:hypothetical protein